MAEFIDRTGRKGRQMTRQEFMYEYGEQLSKKIRKAGIKQGKLAKIIGIHHNTMSDYICGHTSPTVYTDYLMQTELDRRIAELDELS